MYLRLSLLLFLQYAIAGAWVPVFSLRLEEELGFTPNQTAWAWAGWAIGAICASLVAGQVADRWVSIERCLAVSAAAVGALLLVMAEMTSPAAVTTLCVVICLFLVPVTTLGTTLALQHLERPEEQFGRVRMWGTVGWVVSGWLLGLWFAAPDWLGNLGAGWLASAVGPRTLADSQRLGAVMALLLAGYALTLPHTPPLRLGRNWLAPLGAVHLLRRRSFAVYAVCSFLMQMTLPFSIQQTSLLLRSLGLPQGAVSPTLTIAQWSEVALLGCLAAVSLRLGMRGTLLAGLVAWTLALSVLMAGQPLWLVVGSLLLHGVFITCFFIRGQVFINSEAGRDIRASAQGLVTTLNGVGLLLGNLLVGRVRSAFDHQFAPVFAVSVGIALAAMVLFVLGFGRKPQTIEVPPELPAVVPPPEPVQSVVQPSAGPVSVPVPVAVEGAAQKA